MDNKKDEIIEHIPFDLLETIMKFCFGVEYINFRGTCKTCRLAAPVVQWKGSPWLMLLNEKQHQGEGVITFTNPLCGDTYYRKLPRQLTGDLRIHCSLYGWLLMTEFKRQYGYQRLVFFNPFTSEMRKLPKVPSSLESFCFTAPPTSPDCMVFGFHKSSSEWTLYILFVARETSWRTFSLDLYRIHGLHSLCFPIFSVRDLFVLSNHGSIIIFRDIGDEEAHKPHGHRLGIEFGGNPQTSCPSSTKNYFVEHGQDLLQVIVGEYGESVEVFSFNKDWEKIDTLGRHVMFICDTTCLCIEAKTQEMENKIYFPRFHTENGKIVFYSFETGMYHTSNDVMDFVDTKQHLCPHAWIQPNWS